MGKPMDSLVDNAHYRYLVDVCGWRDDDVDALRHHLATFEYHVLLHDDPSTEGVRIECPAGSFDQAISSMPPTGLPIRDVEEHIKLFCEAIITEALDSVPNSLSALQVTDRDQASTIKPIWMRRALILSLFLKREFRHDFYQDAEFVIDKALDVQSRRSIPFAVIWLYIQALIASVGETVREIMSWFPPDK